MGLDAPQINALVGYLHDHRPDTLVRLRARHPTYSRLLQPGIMLGKLDADVVVFADVAQEALQAALEQAEPNWCRLRSRLGRAKSIRLAGNAVATITGVGVLTALVADADAIAIATAIVNLAATLCALYAAHLETSLHGGSGSLVDVFEQLSGSLVEAEGLLRDLTARRRTGTGHEEVLDLVRRANKLTDELHRLERQLA